MERSVKFYKDVLGLRKTVDFGANVTLTGGLSLQTAESWAQFIDRECGELGWCGKVSEIYFEEDDFDAFAEKLSRLDIHYVHPIKEHAWGQRVVRFFDPDGHIIEVGENIKTVCRRFLDSGMSPEQVAERMDVPLKFVKGCTDEECITNGIRAVWKTISQLIELTTLYVISKMHIILLILTYLMCFNIFTVQSFQYRLFGFPKENKSAFWENQSVE